MANQSIPPPRQTLMEAVVDNRGGLFGGRTVVVCGYSVGIKYGDYMHRHEDQCDEAEEYDESKKLKIGRMKKVGKIGLTKRGRGDFVGGKHGLGIRLTR